MHYSPPPHRYKAGDLILHPIYGKCIIVYVLAGTFNTYCLISHDGLQLNTTDSHTYMRNTGLEYDYRDFRQTKLDFVAGVFAPYFNQ
ncbi:hypothetical protein [Larkinella sp. C7]|jgi:hypothetical protein|uniref:hypothetical protein n=1 Tax=Larkinella sp. C7 TaxID=2576607 RepID=UPI00111122FE|nr:hypothetical protein [Larkinella sp. C7]